MNLGGAGAPPPRRCPDRRKVGHDGLEQVVSLTLAAVTTAARGSPPPSQTRWSLVPGLPRSTDLRPRGPPRLARTLMVSTLARSQSSRPCSPRRSDHQAELVEDAGVGPFGEARASRSPVSRSPTPGGQQPPGGGGAGQGQDRGQTRPVGDGAATAILTGSWRNSRGTSRWSHRRWTCWAGCASTWGQPTRTCCEGSWWWPLSWCWGQAPATDSVEHAVEAG